MHQSAVATAKIHHPTIHNYSWQNSNNNIPSCRTPTRVSNNVNPQCPFNPCPVFVSHSEHTNCSECICTLVLSSSSLEFYSRQFNMNSILFACVSCVCVSVSVLNRLFAAILLSVCPFVSRSFLESCRVLRFNSSDGSAIASGQATIVESRAVSQPTNLSLSFLGLSVI